MCDWLMVYLELQVKGALGSYQGVFSMCLKYSSCSGVLYFKLHEGGQLKDIVKLVVAFGIQ
jgi:hypothetical protein